MSTKISLPRVFSNITPSQAQVINGQYAIPFSWLDDNFNEIANKFNSTSTSKVVQTNYTPTVNDDFILVSGITSDITITLPAANTVVNSGEKKWIYIYNSSTYNVTVYGTVTGVFVLHQNEGAMVVTNGNYWFEVKVTGSLNAGYATNAGTANNAISANNSDKVDGYHASVTSTANTIPVADANGKIGAGWLDLPANFGLPNPSFDNDANNDGVPDDWTVYYYPPYGTGGLTNNSVDGGKAFYFTHNGASGSGGGYIESSLVNVFNDFSFYYYATNPALMVKAQVLCYDASKNYIKTLDVYSSTSNPTAWTRVEIKNIIKPLNTRYMKIRLIGGAPSVAVSGSVYFDDVNGQDVGLIELAETIDQPAVNISNETYVDVGQEWNINIPNGVRYLYITVNLSGFEYSQYAGSEVCARFRIGTNYSTEFKAWIGTEPIGVLMMEVSNLNGAQTLVFQAKCPFTVFNYAKLSSPASYKKWYLRGSILVDWMKTPTYVNYANVYIPSYPLAPDAPPEPVA